MTPTRIVVFGGAGRMGRALLRAAIEHDAAAVAAVLTRPDSPLLGEPLSVQFGAAAPDLAFGAALDPDCGAQVLIDFTGPRAFDTALALAREHRLALVSGTTGLSDEQRARLDDAARVIAVLWAANFSLGVALLQRLVATAAAALPPAFDIEIVEAHHRHKQDAPSGTALALGRAAAKARGQIFDDVAVLARQGQVGPRRVGEIGFSVLRGGDIVGEHTVSFIAAGERLELTHRAGSRAVFALGALHAARWIAGKPPGRYEIADVLA
jgi:4-hydroxy-tetrahydrodipicolinate reductase